MAKEPKVVTEVYELLRRIQKEEKVTHEEVGYHLGKALKSKDGQGTWIRREANTRKGEESVSVINIEREKSLVGMRLEAKKKKRDSEEESRP